MQEEFERIVQNLLEEQRRMKSEFEDYANLISELLVENAIPHRLKIDDKNCYWVCEDHKSRISLSLGGTLLFVIHGAVVFLTNEGDFFEGIFGDESMMGLSEYKKSRENIKQLVEWICK